MELVHLILHQSDQRGNHYCQSGASDNGRKLKAQRFPASGGQKGESVAPGHMRLDNLALERAESIVTKSEAESIENFRHETELVLTLGRMLFHTIQNMPESPPQTIRRYDSWNLRVDSVK